jgi:DNA polymerase-4
MRMPEILQLCPHFVPVNARPYIYRIYHTKIMSVLGKYCDDIIPRSIDEAVLNMTSYQLIYKDFKKIGRDIMDEIKEVCGPLITCSVGIAPNAFLAKLATEIADKDELIEITPDNIDEYLKGMKLKKLPGIASRNERRLNMVGIFNPYQMRHTSAEILRKAFGGVVGNYWHTRLNFGEVDLYTSDFRTMSSMRSISREQRESIEKLEALLVSLCMKMEMRMVKQKVFCREATFYIKYFDEVGFETHIKFPHPIQDGMELRRYILERMEEYMKPRGLTTMFTNKSQSMGVVILNFVKDNVMQYSLFDNNIQRDTARRAVYDIKDRYGSKFARRASETIESDVMRDAIGFGSVKDMYDGGNDGEGGGYYNAYMIEERK